jgi:hypothetical protein
MRVYDEQSSSTLTEAREVSNMCYQSPHESLEGVRTKFSKRPRDHCGGMGSRGGDGPPGQALQFSIDRFRRGIASTSISSVVSSLQATSDVLALDGIASNLEGKNGDQITRDTEYAVPKDSGQLHPLAQHSLLQANSAGGGTGTANSNNEELINEGVGDLSELMQDWYRFNEVQEAIDMIIHEDDPAMIFTSPREVELRVEQPVSQSPYFLPAGTKIPSPCIQPETLPVMHVISPRSSS